MNVREKATVSKMIRIYCRIKHRQKDTLCAGCRQLEGYAHGRLERCLFGDDKPACKQCPVHCYKPEYREKIREVMKFAGPRMFWHNPKDAAIHVWQLLMRSSKNE